LAVKTFASLVLASAEMDENPIEPAIIANANNFFIFCSPLKILVAVEFGKN